MLINELGKVILVKLMQLSKVESPMLINELGKVILVKLVQLLKV